MEDETTEGDTVQPQVFAGDFFGDNYSSDDFPGWDNREEAAYASEDESIHPEEYVCLVFLQQCYYLTFLDVCVGLWKWSR